VRVSRRVWGACTCDAGSAARAGGESESVGEVKDERKGSVAGRVRVVEPKVDEEVALAAL
jgi:hypothetical protein